MNEGKEGKLEKRASERGIIITGSSDIISDIEEKYKDILKTIDYEKSRDGSCIIYTGAGESLEKVIECAMNIKKLQREIIVVGYGVDHESEIERLKFPEVRRISIEDLDIKRDVHTYLFEENLDKNFSNKNYISKIKGSQINYKIKR